VVQAQQAATLRDIATRVGRTNQHCQLRTLDPRPVRDDLMPHTEVERTIRARSRCGLGGRDRTLSREPMQITASEWPDRVALGGDGV
jgi:hypothetical protein